MSEQRVRELIQESSNYISTSLMKFYLQHEDFSTIKTFNENVELAKNWNETIEVKQQEIEALNENLKKQKNAYNFVGLHKGFKRLATQKNIEKWFATALLFIMAIIILLPLLLKIISLMNYEQIVSVSKTSPIPNEQIVTSNNSDQENASTPKDEDSLLEKSKELIVTSASYFHTSDQVPLLLTIFSLEFILIYFFRIVLFNYRSAKAQLLQIELRMSLCEFIQDYSKYSVEIRKDNEEALKGFENLIFSGIAIEDSKIPTTFDGLAALNNFPSC